MVGKDDHLIAKAQQGRQEGFEALYNRYLPQIYRFVYMKVSHTEEAEDLAHEVFVTAWQNIGSYEMRGFPFSSWLYQIARNKIIDHYRTKRRLIPLEAIAAELAVEHSIEDTLDRTLTLDDVRAAIHHLTQNQQDVILMRFMEDLTHDEIAVILKKSSGAIRLIQHRAVNSLQKLLKGQRTGTVKRFFQAKRMRELF